MTQFSEEKSSQKLTQLRLKEEEESTKLLSQKYNIPYLDLSLFPIEIDALRIVSEEKARFCQLAIFQMVGHELKIGVHNPEREETKALLKELEDNHHTCDLYLVSRHSLEHAWEFYKKVPEKKLGMSGSIQVLPESVAALQKEITSLPVLKTHIENTFSGKTTEMLEIILAGALALDASDVHIEPQEHDVRLRLRTDGLLYDIAFLPTHLYALLLSRIKLVSEMKLNIHDKAQDGRFTIHAGDADIEIRVSVLPGPYGENSVLRVLNPKSIQVSFESLGMQPWIIETMERELDQPNGMIINTGPTGSGKTTTLYAFLKKVHTPDIKIITLEDPIEYHLTGIEQTQVEPDKGYDFANGLRAIVRQDPDVILVGEIRDKETAAIAIQASLTGHLVFSTLHTNDAAGTIPRLMDLGIRSSLIAPAINIVMAQRLVRKLCPDCKIKTEGDDALIKKIKTELSDFPKKIPVPPESSWTIFSPNASGCASCNATGYKGRIGVYEIIVIDETLETLILKEPSEYDIKRAALAQGQITMKQDGILKILTGLTDFSELERILG